MGVAMLQAAQESLKEELRQDEQEGRGKKRRIQEDQEGEGSEEDGEGSSGGMSLLSRAANQLGRSGGKQSARMKEIRSFSDPYAMDVRDQSGMNDMIDVYGLHGSDGTVRASRMQSSVGEEPLPKGYFSLKLPQKNLSLITSDKDKLMVRAIEILPMLSTMHKSRWYPLHGGDWKLSVPRFRTEFYKLWSMDKGDRNVPGWNEDIRTFTLVSKAACLQNDETMTRLYGMNWSLTSDGLSIADFDEVKNESRSHDKTVCGVYNKGLTCTIARLQDLMTSIMSGYYEGAFKGFMDFVSRDESIIMTGGDQLEHNFARAMGRVSAPIRKGNSMIMPDGTVYEMDGPEGVAAAISASLAFQIEFMKDEQLMRTQNDTFRERIKIMQSRAKVGENSTDIKASGEEGKEEGKGKQDKGKGKKEERIKDREQERARKDRQAARLAIKEEPGATKPAFLCMRNLGESLGVRLDGKVINCRHGTACKFKHRSAALTTFTEAQEAIEKTVDSPMKTEIKKAMDAFRYFLK
jgi:hypothetical protein